MKNFIFYINLIVALLCSCTDMPDEFYWKINNVRVYNAYHSYDPKHVSVRFNLDVPLEASAEEELTEAYLVAKRRWDNTELTRVDIKDQLDHWKGGTVPVYLEIPYLNTNSYNKEEDTYIYIYLASPHCFFNNDDRPICTVKGVPDVTHFVKFHWEDVTDITSTSARVNIRYENPTQLAWKENEVFNIELFDYSNRKYRKIDIPFPKEVQEQSKCIISAVIDGLTPNSHYEASFYWANYPSGHTRIEISFYTNK